MCNNEILPVQYLFITFTSLGLNFLFDGSNLIVHRKEWE
jgi:hypothetical protein